MSIGEVLERGQIAGLFDKAVLTAGRFPARFLMCKIMSKFREIPIATLRALVSYNPETGKLLLEGNPAFESVTTRGYRCGKICGGLFKAHRVAWAVYHGSWPVGEIDHINGVRDDNRIVNLRDIPGFQNKRNLPRLRRNKSGVTGVRWFAKSNKWMAKICVASKNIHLGLFEHKTDAIAARRAAEIAHNFHPNHGRETAS